MVLDVLKPLQHKQILQHELEGFGLRLNKSPPNITFRRKDKGGINLTATVYCQHRQLFTSQLQLLVQLTQFLAHGMRCLQLAGYL